MMKKALLHLQQRLTLVTTLSLAVTPVLGYGLANFLEIINGSQLLANSPVVAVLSGLYLALVIGGSLFFKRFLQPVIDWKLNHLDQALLPEKLNLHLQSFSSSYWSFFLLFVFIFPTTHHWLLSYAGAPMSLSGLMQFMLLQLVVVIMAAIPGYLYSLSTLGKLTHYTGLANVQVSMRTKMLLVGAYIPLLTTSILLKYYWWRTGFITFESVLVWGMMGLTAVITTLVAYRSLSQSLKPIQSVTSGKGASNYETLARQFKPHSNDEIGFLVQTLGRLFNRVNEQDQYVQTVFEHAAEAIIVVNREKYITMFNPAAETLFGFSANEAQHRSLSWLIPGLTLENGDNIHNKEFNAQHRSGKQLVLSMQISSMQMHNEDYFILLASDISDRKATEIMLIEAEERYRNLVVTAHDLVWSMDVEGRWTYMNDAVKRMYGYDADELLYKDISILQTKESVTRDEEAFQSVIAGKDLLGYETRHFDKQGRVKHISFNARPHINSHGHVEYITGTARDITEQKSFESELTYQAQHDLLTGLYNRNYFQQELQRLLSRISRSGAECALIFLDLDQFKYINDTLGHASGDQLLIECSQLLKAKLRDGDLLARFGGDEFTIVLYNIDKKATEKVAQNLLQVISDYRFYENNQSFNISCSMGITHINSETESVDVALAHADTACNVAKSQGRNCFHIYNPEGNDIDGMAADMGWANRVKDAYENDQFSLVYQPIVDINTGQIQDYEVLLRMTLDDGQKMLPGGFIPAAERFGLIHNVDRWTVKNAMHALSDIHIKKPDVRFAINLSGRAFEDKELLPLIQNTLTEYSLDPTCISFEITESAAIANITAAKDFIISLKDIGCEFALDDFGTGFSSFSYLKNLPVDKLKIDGSFIQSLESGNVDCAVVQAMNQVAHALGKQTIAEFVENKSTLNLLKEYGVDFAQGYYLGKPAMEIHSDFMFTDKTDSEIVYN